MNAAETRKIRGERIAIAPYPTGPCASCGSAARGQKADGSRICAYCIRQAHRHGWLSMTDLSALRT